MKGRRRSRSDGLPRWVYTKGGSFYWVRPTDRRWIRLSRIEEGETTMLHRLAEEKRKVEIDGTEGTMSRLVAIYMDQEAGKYADSFRDEWKRRGEDVRKAFKAFDIEQVDAASVVDFLEGNWADKVPTQRAMKGWLSKFFTWAVLRRHVATNPCREVKVKKPKPRSTYMPDNHFMAIREALLTYTYERRLRGKLETVTAKVPTGPEMQVLIDLCYLTMQRSTDIRLLRLSQIDWQTRLIRFLPTKTEDSSGAAVDWPITPEIEAVLKRAEELRRRVKVQSISDDYVILDQDGQPKTAKACLQAWRKAMARAKLADRQYTIKDIRAKAMTDAKRAGYDLDALQVAGVHTDRATTEDYIKQREVPVSVVHLHLPAGHAKRA